MRILTLKLMKAHSYTQVQAALALSLYYQVLLYLLFTAFICGSVFIYRVIECMNAFLFVFLYVCMSCHVRLASCVARCMYVSMYSIYYYIYYCVSYECPYLYISIIYYCICACVIECLCMNVYIYEWSMHGSTHTYVRWCLSSCVLFLCIPNVGMERHHVTDIKPSTNL